MSVYGIKDCANLTLFDKATDDVALYSDYANVSTNEWTSDRVFANSKGTQSIAWDANKKGTFVVEMETFDLKWLAITAGSEITTGESTLAKREILKVGAGKKATITGSPLAGSIQIVKVAQDEVEHIGEKLEEVVVDGTIVTAVGTGQFAVTGSEVTFASDAVVGEAYAVYYVVQQTGVKKFVISADKFPKAFRIVADALIREKETGKDEFVQIEYPHARPQGNMTITMSATEPTNLQITFDLFPNKKQEMAEYKIVE